MPWTVRYRFRVSKPLHSDAQQLPFAIGGREALVCGESTKPLSGSEWMTMYVHDFESEEIARNFGEQVGRALLLAGARQDVGIDAGENRASVSFGQGPSMPWRSWGAG